MKNHSKLNLHMPPIMVLLIGLLFSYGATFAQQRATVAIPVSIGMQCNNSRDSVKYFDYNSTTNVLTHRWDCRPSLAAPTFSIYGSGITFNPFDGNLYYTRLQSMGGGVVNSHVYRWLPTTCPGASLPIFRTFANQTVLGCEFDPVTGLGYQVNFVDTTGVPSATPDAGGDVGQFSSAAVVNGNPAIAYYDNSNDRLKFVRAKDAQGIDWNTAITITPAANVGQYVSLLVVNGNPAIAYYNVTNGDLMYVRATDADGTAWGAPVTVESTNNVGQFTSMAIVNGNPAISYYDVTNSDLRYVRASNVNGTAWSAPVAVATAGNSGQYSSMKVVNGNPAIAYYDATGANLNLMYVRAADVNGAGWGAAVIADAANDVGQFASLEVVNGNPAISYFDNTNSDLRFVRATNVTGTAWAASIAVTTAGNIGSYTSLQIVNGNPAVGYYDISNGDLKYVRATNNNGSAWGAPITAEATGTTGQFASMIISNGNPAIAYYDQGNGNVKYIRAYDVNGVLWFRNVGIYDMELQEVNYATGTLGPSRPVDFGNRYIYQQNGDITTTPSGLFLGVYNNKYFTINWKDYATAIPLRATYIDTIVLPAGNSLVGLTYSDGKLISSISGSSACNSSYQEIDILTGAQSAITYAAGTNLFYSTDMANITSGIGSSKRVISTTENPVGSGIYDVIYEITLKNYGTTPVSNVQVYDTLTRINGVANALGGSVSIISAPPGFTANPAFDGQSAGNYNLLLPGGTLSYIPGLNTVLLQVNARVSGIIPGFIYYNQATVRANTIFGDALVDFSTTGPSPDLNGNDKPDDVGENQPTPFLISVTPHTPPCISLTKTLFTQTFGTGTGLSASPPAPVPGAGVFGISNSTGYTPVVTQPVPVERFTISNNANNANTLDFVNLTDHTGNANGRMLIVNADASNSRFYTGSFVYTLCAKQQYSVSFHAAFIGNANYSGICDGFGGFKYPKVKIRVRDGITGLIITEISTPDIISTSWTQYGVKFVSPSTYNSIIFDLINDAPGGCGNDIAIDDVLFGSCDPLPVVGVNTAAGCLGATTSLTGGLTDPDAIPGTKDYQWQIAPSATGPWTNIFGATSPTYVINPITASDTGKHFRLLVAATGNIANVNCRFNSPSTYLAGKSYSIMPTSAGTNKANICAGIQASVNLTGGTLGTNATWNWYEGSCTGTLAGTGATINVMPSVTTTYYVRAEGDCNTTACQPVTIFITCDIDKDNDGIPDYVESYMPAAMLDHNSDGIPNAFDPLYPGYVDYNNDHINDNFQADGDSDNDGILNYLDTSFPGRVDTNADGRDDRFDMDLDGIINMLDLDSDNDGITDVVEAGGVDANGDGRIDNYTDTDDDGLSQNVDGNNTGARISGTGLGVSDLDGDGRPNTVDLDSDGDGIPDVVEALGPDANNNARIDGFVDVNLDGLHDSYINATALLRSGADINADGRADSYPNKNFDNDGRSNAYDIDSDNDGIVDVLEAGFADTDYNSFIDGAISADGWNTALHALPALGLRNSDVDANFNYLDIDSDADGIPDNIEGQATLAYRFPAYADADNDGLDNNYDLAPFAASFGGAGIFLSDKDLDGTPDYLDLDTDSDGAPDITEGHDYNFNGFADDLVTPTGIDTDGDGLDDRFDLINSGAYLKGTSSLMGTGGSLAGDGTPGSRATVQKFNIAQPERDWRYVTYVLPLQYLQLSAAENKQNVSLTWGVITDKALDVFEIERSTDNRTFYKIAEQSADMPLDQLSNFSGNDNINAVGTDIVFYRIKVIAKNGQLAYSNVVLVRKSNVKNPISVYPNPAKEAVSVSFYADKETEVIISIKDNVGQTVYTQKQKAHKGNNTVPVTNLNKYSDGVYSVQIMMNDELVTVRLIIQN